MKTPDAATVRYDSTGKCLDCGGVGGCHALDCPPMAAKYAEPVAASETGGDATARCKPGKHIFPPFKDSGDLGGGAQRCECGNVLIDRTLGGGRVVELNDGILRGR